ncbi:MAG: DUF4833 domain-containing protein [Polyangiaceae bacterium]|nr:DUF4833 domain-containing protein [Polyangiaceae bacterium]
MDSIGSDAYHIYLMCRVPLIVSALLAASTSARADPRFHPSDVQSVFFIGKSDDRNQVHYGLHLDGDCVPVGEQPVYAYWLQVEKGNVTEDLNFLDRSVYGVKGQQVAQRSVKESKVLMTVKAAPDRAIEIVIHKRDGKCIADPIATINGAPARVGSVFVHVAGWLRVDWIEIRGTANGKPVVERVKH